MVYINSALFPAAAAAAAAVEKESWEEGSSAEDPIQERSDLTNRSVVSYKSLHADASPSCSNAAGSLLADASTK
jgi:hypothetical protein